jgi:hypothetical protein
MKHNIYSFSKGDLYKDSNGTEWCVQKVYLYDRKVLSEQVNEKIYKTHSIDDELIIR